MLSKVIGIIGKVELEPTGEQRFPRIEWAEESNVAVHIDSRYFTLFVDNKGPIDLRNGWSANQSMHAAKGLNLMGWHFKDAFVDGKTGEDEIISYRHMVRLPAKGAMVYFLKVRFEPEKLYMVNIATLVRDHLEIYG